MSAEQTASSRVPSEPASRLRDLNENPYAPPQAECLKEADADSLLRGATRLYRIMGLAGVAYCLVVFPFVFASETSKSSFKLPDMMIVTATMGLSLVFFVLMLRTARRLQTNPAGWYRMARWMGILAAALFFPFLTVPAILALNQLERHRRLSHLSQPGD
jgi:hypothetical protein